MKTVAQMLNGKAHSQVHTIAAAATMFEALQVMAEE